MEEPDFWDRPEEAQELMKQLSSMKDDRDTYQRLVSAKEDMETLIEMGYEENDASVIPEIQEMLDTFKEDFEAIRIKTLLSGEFDSNNAIIKLNAGAGGTEACDWCGMLYRMYTRWAERKGFTLEELDASDNMLTDLTVLGSLSALQTLTLANNRITDISPLAGCKSLTYVDLSYNYGLNSDNTERGISDLSPLFENTQLRTLIAGHNLISDVEGIEALEELSYLDLTDNYLDSLAPLAEAASLETVLLHSNALTSLDPLAGNTTIRTLDVSLNMISNFDAINTMPALRSLTWEQNNIQDYSAIDAFEERMSALQNRRQKLQGN